MAEITLDLMSNSELKIKMTEYENEYEVLKNKMRECVARMEYLNKMYLKAKAIHDKRTKGVV